LSLFAGCRLMRIDALLKTEKDRLAVFYDTGLVADRESWSEVAFYDTEGRLQKVNILAHLAGTLSQRARDEGMAKPLKVRHRTIVAAAEQGAVACFPPPHHFQFPRDYSTNLGFVWAGEGYQGQAGKVGFGI